MTKTNKTKTVAYIFTLSLFLMLGADQALAVPAPPAFPPAAPAISSTATTTNNTAAVAGTTTAAASTASKTSSGPGEIIAVVGLALVAVFSLKKYSQSKKYNL